MTRRLVQSGLAAYRVLYCFEAELPLSPDLAAVSEGAELCLAVVSAIKLDTPVLVEEPVPEVEELDSLLCCFLPARKQRMLLRY